jgi:hypothetical protein
MKIIHQNNNLISIIKKISVDQVLYLLLAIALSILFYYNIAYIDKPIVEWYSFRQTQTALTAEYLIKNGFSFDYETPVVGQGWSIPFEFPIYQQIVAWITQLTRLPITNVGRAVNFTFFLLTLIPIFNILRILDVNKRAVIFILILYFTAPVNIFWSGGFTIEECAQFFMLSFLYYALKILVRNFTSKDILLMFIFSTLGFLQKSTTIIPVFILVSLVFMFWFVRIQDLLAGKKNIILIFAALAISFWVGYEWVVFTDSVKEKNIIGRYLTSKALQSFNFGSFDQRISAKLWYEVIYGRIISTSIGPLAIILMLIAIILKKNTYRFVILTSIILFLSPFLIFTNLHIQHDYYQAANVIFWNISLGLSIIIIGDRLIGDRTTTRKFIYIFLLIAIYSYNLFSFYGSIFYKQRILDIKETTERSLMITNYVKNNTPEDSIVVWYGFDWNSIGAFYSGRRSLTVPHYGDIQIDSANHVEKYISSKPSAIVICPFNQRDSVESIIKSKYPTARTHAIRDCTIYLLTP